MNVAIKLKNMVSRAALVGMVSLITGSTNGIGLGIPRALAAQSARFPFSSPLVAASITGVALPVDGGWTAH
jgi:3-hydroxybutyrate dehydrogenase